MVEKASHFKDALKTSHTLTRMLTLQEAKNQPMKKLPPFTSLLIPTPEDIQQRITQARRLSEYEMAKNEAKSYFENEVSLRLKEFSRSKIEAMMKTANGPSAPIILAPIVGDYLFGPKNVRSIAKNTESDDALDEYLRRRAIYGSNGE